MELEPLRRRGTQAAHMAGLKENPLSFNFGARGAKQLQGFSVAVKLHAYGFEDPVSLVFQALQRICVQKLIVRDQALWSLPGSWCRRRLDGALAPALTAAAPGRTGRGSARSVF